MPDLAPPDDLLFRLIWRLGRHSAVRRYLTRLPRLLPSDYGHGGPYRAPQVEATIRRNRGFSTQFIPYAQALFCDETSVRAAWRDAEISARYEAIRRDLGDSLFGGGYSGDYSYSDVRRYASHSWSEGSAGHGGDGIGHHGADGVHGGH